MKNYFHIGLVIWIFAVAVSKSESITAEDTNSYSTVRIEALNKVTIASGSNSLPALTEIMLPGGEKKTAVKIMEELAMQGVSIRWNGNRYIDATKEVTKGYSLKDDELKMLALMNYIEQNSGLLLLKKIPDIKNTGQATTHTKAIKQKLLERGISVLWEDDIYIVQTIQPANPSAASRMVQSNIIGQWVCLSNVPGLVLNKNIQYIHFRTDGSVEYKQQSGDNLVNKTESYKLIHKGTDKNYPGKNPNILITKNTNDTNGILLLDVSVDFDSRLPMKIGKVLKCSDIESNKYFFVKQDSRSKISGDQNELKVPYNEADKQRIIHLSGWFESKLIEILLDNKIIFKGILYPSDRTPQIKTVSIPSKTDARCELQIKIDNELIINYMITDRNLKKQTPLSVKDGILSIDWINGKIVSLSWNKQNKKIYVYQNDKIGYQ